MSIRENMMTSRKGYDAKAWFGGVTRETATFSGIVSSAISKRYEQINTNEDKSLIEADARVHDLDENSSTVSRESDNNAFEAGRYIVGDTFMRNFNPE